MQSYQDIKRAGASTVSIDMCNLLIPFKQKTCGRCFTDGLLLLGQLNVGALYFS